MSQALRDDVALKIYLLLVRKMDSATRRKYRDGRADGREAKMAYQLADAFMAARSGGDPERLDDSPDEGTLRSCAAVDAVKES